MKRVRTVYISDDVWKKLQEGAYNERLNMDKYILKLLGGARDAEENNENVREGI